MRILIRFDLILTLFGLILKPSAVLLKEVLGPPRKSHRSFEIKFNSNQNQNQIKSSKIRTRILKIVENLRNPSKSLSHNPRYSLES